MDNYVNCGILLHISYTYKVYVVALMLQMLQMDMVEELDMVEHSYNSVGCDQISYKLYNFCSFHLHVSW